MVRIQSTKIFHKVFKPIFGYTPASQCPFSSEGTQEDLLHDLFLPIQDVLGFWTPKLYTVYLEDMLIYANYVF